MPDYPPPPPPAKSGVLKWVLIGCGTVTILGMICCGGFLFMGGGFMNSYMESLEEAHKLIRTSPEIKKEIGEIRSIDVGDNFMGAEGKKSSGKMQDGLQWKVQGAQKSGVAIGKLDMVSMKLRLVSLKFQVDGGPTLDIK